MTNTRYDFLVFMALLGFPEEAVNALIAGYDAILACESSRERFVPIVENYRDKREFNIGKTCEAAILSSRECGAHEYTCLLVFYMCTAMYSYPAFVEKGLSKEEWLDSMADYRCKLFECHDRYGVWGTFVNWFDKWYTGDRTTYGRFAFEVVDCPGDYKGDGFEVKVGQKVIAAHILNNKEKPFTKEAWTEAYGRAEEHFKNQLDGAEPIFYVISWLLFPKHFEMLPADSKILQFISEYEIMGTWPTRNDLWRIFNIEDCNQDPSTFDESTSLRRAYKKFMLEGGEPCCSAGFRLPNSKRQNKE